MQYTTEIQRGLLKAIVMVASVAGVATPVFSQVNDTPQANRPTEKANNISIDDLPAVARRILDDERGERKVLGIQRVVHTNGKMFYLATIAVSDGRRNIRISQDGELLGSDEIRDADLATYKQTGGPNDWYRQREERDAIRRTYWATVNEKVAALAESPERVSIEEVPSQVQMTFAREALGERIDTVVRYRDKTGVVYQTSVPDGPGKVRVLQVAFDGQLINSTRLTVAGRPIDDRRARTLDYADLPRVVKETLDKNYPKTRIPHVDFVERANRKYYNVELEDNGRDRFIVINEDGKIIADIADRDYSSAVPRR